MENILIIVALMILGINFFLTVSFSREAATVTGTMYREERKPRKKKTNRNKNVKRKAPVKKQKAVKKKSRGLGSKLTLKKPMEKEIVNDLNDDTLEFDGLEGFDDLGDLDLDMNDNFGNIGNDMDAGIDDLVLDDDLEGLDDILGDSSSQTERMKKEVKKPTSIEDEFKELFAEDETQDFEPRKKGFERKEVVIEKNNKENEDDLSFLKDYDLSSMFGGETNKEEEKNDFDLDNYMFEEEKETKKEDIDNDFSDLENLTIPAIEGLNYEKDEKRIEPKRKQARKEEQSDFSMDDFDGDEILQKLEELSKNID